MLEPGVDPDDVVFGQRADRGFETQQRENVVVARLREIAPRAEELLLGVQHVYLRGARNLPCVTVPGKRAPTWQQCESDENYVPLNDGYNWKGDPNATLSGQPVPHVPPRVPPAESTSQPAAVPPPIAAAEYDLSSGTYVGPDGHVYTQADLARGANEEQTWQKMLLPPEGN